MPSILYKYMSPQLLGALSSARMRHTPLGAFNDPFDGLPHLSGFVPPLALGDEWRKYVPSELAKLYLALPERLKRVLGSVSGMDEREQRLRAIKNVAMIEEVSQESSHFTDMLRDLVDRHLGILCLSEVPDSLLMWSHYASSHTGFALALDAKHSYFTSGNTVYQPLIPLTPVKYHRVRPSGHLFTLSPSELICTKDETWSYEREWRVMSSLDQAQDVIEQTPYPIHLFSVPSEAILSVIVGGRSTSSFRSEVQYVLRNNPNLAHVKLRYAMLDDYEYRVQLL